MIAWMRIGLGVLVGMYLTALCVALVVIVLGSGRTGWPALLRELSHLLFAPLPILLLPALVMRARVTLLSLSIPLLVFTTCYGPQLLPREAAPEPGLAFRVLTFNVGASRGLAQPGEMLRTIESNRPDVIGLVEAPGNTLATVGDGLRGAYPYQARSNDIFVLSRFPLTGLRPGIVSIGAKDSLQATLEVDHRLVTLTVVQLRRADSYSGLRSGPRLLAGAVRAFSTDVRDEAVSELIRLIRAEGGAQVLVGDLNMTPTSQAYHVLRADLQDAFVEAGWGLGHTYPTRLRTAGSDLSVPLVRIDYILHSSNLVASRAWVGQRGSSDHLPLVADLNFR